MGTQKSLFMKFMLRLRTAGNSRVFKYISTKSAIRRENFVEKCQVAVRLDVNLGELLKFDMLVGLLGGARDMHINTTAIYADVAASQQATFIQQMSLSTPLTFVLRLDETAMATGAYDAYEIDVVTVFTMYFLSNVKKNSALRLLQAGLGFSQAPDGSLLPDDDLLRICPLHRIEGVYGCIARFEVQHSMYELNRRPYFQLQPTQSCAGWGHQRGRNVSARRRALLSTTWLHTPLVFASGSMWTPRCAKVT